MKNLIFILIFSLSLFGKTIYKEPAFVVNGQELYCTDYYGETIVTKKIGDILEGEYASDYCAYNIESTIEKQKYQASVNSREEDEQRDKIGLFLISFIAFILISALAMIVYLILKEEKD